MTFYCLIDTVVYCFIESESVGVMDEVLSGIDGSCGLCIFITCQFVMNSLNLSQHIIRVEGR